MEGLKIYSKSTIERLISTRKGETKFGENLQFIEGMDELEKNPAKYVLLGIPEDIGVLANHGKQGTAKAWEATLKSLANIQSNQFNDPSKLILLGIIDCEALMHKASNIDEPDPNYHAKLGDLVNQIDIMVADTVEKIISSGKIPIIIGGGHNNAYGNIKGASKALKGPVNIINIDAHTDLRQLEHRHSGNGFSYAIAGKYLDKYTIFGLHKNYTPQYIFDAIHTSETIKFNLIEDLLKDTQDMEVQFKHAIADLGTNKFGFELDCDAIAGFPSSAKSPSGFTLNQVRNFTDKVSSNENCCYFHICEAAPEPENAAEVGKALAYLISDIIRN